MASPARPKETEQALFDQGWEKLINNQNPTELIKNYQWVHFNKLDVNITHDTIGLSENLTLLDIILT